MVHPMKIVKNLNIKGVICTMEKYSLKNIIKTVFDQHGAKTLFLGSWESLDENMLKQILKIEYNIKNNDEFLKLENHISLIRKLINARSN